RFVIRYRPSLSATVVRVSFVATFLAVIDTPGSTPPLASLIVPVRLALDCATAEDGSRDNTRILRVPRYFGMTTSESRWATARMRARVDNRIDRGCQSAVEVDCATAL